MKPEEDEPKWERWQKDRTFVRAVVGKYDEIYKNLYNQPGYTRARIYPGKGGRQNSARMLSIPRKI